MEYDLTRQMIPYMDRHLAFPLLEFLVSKGFYNADDLLQAEYDLMSKTNMVDFLEYTYKKIHPCDSIPEDLVEKRKNVSSVEEQLHSDVEHVMSIIENPEVINALRQDKYQNMKFLQENYGVTWEMITSLFEYGKFQYNCGNYGAAADLLYHFRILSTDQEMNLAALWGKLASEILTGNWEVALEDIQKLRESIDQKGYGDPLRQLNLRTWVIHWSLFVFFNHSKGRDGIIDMFFQAPYLNAIQTSCPWILRYLTTAVVTNKKRKSSLKELVKIIQQESYAYSDPITEFVENLYVHFDFEQVQVKLGECEAVLTNDFFLVGTREDFVENARFFICEASFNIYDRIDIGMLLNELNMDRDEGEKWIVNVIRDTRMDAKINFKEGTIVINPNYPNVYQQVLERTKGLAFRSQVLMSGIEKRENLLMKDASKGGAQ